MELEVEPTPDPNAPPVESLPDSPAPESLPPSPPPSPAPPPDELARLREDNARLRGENAALRSPRREPEAPPADPHTAEFAAIEKAYAAGEINDAERTMRLGALGAEVALGRREAREREEAGKRREDAVRARASERIGKYMARVPGLHTPSSPEMQRVLPHLNAVAEEFGFETTDPRAQVLALERTFGPLERSPVMDHREFERRRHPVGGGGGVGGDEPAPPAKPSSHGERIWNKLLPEYQKFFVDMRGSKEAAIRSLEHADEHQMRKQGRFREGSAA